MRGTKNATEPVLSKDMKHTKETKVSNYIYLHMISQHHEVYRTLHLALDDLLVIRKEFWVGDQLTTGHK